MAIKPNSKGKVKGTKKKDKITWASKSAWEKTLTVYAGAGNDLINFKKSKYKNKLYGEAGKDTIYGGTKNDTIYGGKGNDSINAGKGTNSIYFAKNDGKDTIVSGGGTDTLIFTDENLGNIKASYSGNNAVITYTGGTITLKDYKKGNHSAKYVQVDKTKKAIADYFKTVTPSTPTQPSTPANLVDGYYVINGNQETLTANDNYDCKITGGAGNNTIYSGAGNDVINAGAGENIINFNKHSNGNDTIISGTGTDTIVLPNETSFSNINPLYLGDNLAITYSNGSVILGSIVLQDYLKGNHSVKNIKINGITKTIDEVLPYNEVHRAPGSHDLTGTNYKDRIVSDMERDKIYALGGNDYIEIKQGGTTVEAGAGDDSVWVLKSTKNSFYFNDGDGNDTIQYDTSYQKGHYIFSDETDILSLTLTVNEGEGFTIGYNNNNDSVRVILPTREYCNFASWKAEYNYDNYFYDEDSDYNYNVEVNNKKYVATTKGFSPVYYVNTNLVSATNNNDYIYINNYEDTATPITEIRALDGDDYIRASSYEYGDGEVYYSDIYAGKGSDTISCGNIHFYSGDGNDYIGSYYADENEWYGPSRDLLIFEDETSLENLYITKDGDDVLIKYNGDADSIRLKNFVNDGWVQYIKIADNKYALPDSQYDGYYNIDRDSDLTGIIGTNGDDTINYYMEGSKELNILFGDGNDVLNIENNSDTLGAYFNVNAEGDVNDNDLIVCNYYNQENSRYDEEIEDYISYYEATKYDTLILKDYLLNSDTKTICNENGEILDVSNLNTVKAAVAGWLSTNGYGDVSAAITDETKGAENLAILLGEGYFGELQWS